MTWTALPEGMPVTSTSKHHPTFTERACRRFMAALHQQGHRYSGVAAALQAAGLPRPSEGTPEYRDAVLTALAGSEGRFPPGWLDALDAPPSMPDGYWDALVRS